jgi:hypothetical protein
MIVVCSVKVYIRYLLILWLVSTVAFATSPNPREIPCDPTIPRVAGEAPQLNITEESLGEWRIYVISLDDGFYISGASSKNLLVNKSDLEMILEKSLGISMSSTRAWNIRMDKTLGCHIFEARSSF